MNARNKGYLSNEDYSEYLKLYGDFVAAKGQPQIKKKNVKHYKHYIRNQFITNNIIILFFICYSKTNYIYII